jgi:hypothetical protein
VEQDMKALDKTQNNMKEEIIVKKLSDEQIELVANIFSQGNQHLLADMEVEWLLCHAFQLGAKFYRDFTNIEL